MVSDLKRGEGIEECILYTTITPLSPFDIIIHNKLLPIEWVLSFKIPRASRYINSPMHPSLCFHSNYIDFPLVFVQESA